MTENKNEKTTLKWNVLPTIRPSLTRDIPYGDESLMWVANTATLIHGEKDAVLVDTFLTADQNKALIDWVVSSGKNLTTIYITHGHGDHFFGIKMLLDRFPNARAIATSGAIQFMKEESSRGNFWEELFPGQLPEDIVTAEELVGNEFELEGHKMVSIDTGFTDSKDTTVLHVPSIGLVVAGDVAYNGIHPYMANTNKQTRLEWIDALDRIEALKPSAVVVGHKKPLNEDNPEIIAETRKYIQDFNRLDEVTTTSEELFKKMLEIYPDRANPGSLWSSAKAVKS